MNPLIAETHKATIQNAAEAFAAFMVMLAVTDSNLCRLLSPIQAAIEHVADAE
jgi:hypothetical protein